MALIFNNQPNFTIQDPSTGEEYWVSRSVAICAVMFFEFQNSVYLPLGMRSEDLILYPGYWGLVSGSLDWGENLPQCIIREVYEELGFNPAEYCIIPDQPDYVFSEPWSSENQTVTMRFTWMVQVKELPALFPGPEVSQVQWCNLSNYEYRKLKLAFNHLEIIDWAINYLNYKN